MKYAVEPWKHQLETIELAVERPGFGLFWEMGTGKTMTTVNILRHRFRRERRILRVLILCPLSMVETWRREFERHGGPATSAAVQCLSSRSWQGKLKQLKTPGKSIFVMNLESVNSKAWPEISKLPWDGIVVDELHNFKSWEAGRTKRLLAISPKIPFRLGLTGTLVTNSAMELWSQLMFLEPKTFHENFWAFRFQYFEDKNAAMPSHKHFPNWQPKPGAYEELKEKIRSCGTIVKKAEALDLPPLVRTEVFVELLPEQRRLYDEMEENFVTYLDSNEAIVAEVALTKVLRLQQIVSGVASTDAGEKRSIPTAKTEALREILEGISGEHKAIVWARWRDCYDQIENVCRELKLPCVRIVGGQTREERQEAIDRFNADPSVRVVIANQKAGGVGIGLQAASYSIYYAKDFNLEHDLQSESRNHRGGSEIHERITRIDIVAKDTVDERVTEALRNKQSVSEFLTSVKQRFKEAA